MSRSSSASIGGASLSHTTNTVCCDFYLSKKGCKRDANCDHAHPRAPNGDVTKQICSFFVSKRGCTEAQCNRLHPLRLNPLGQPCERICAFYITPQGCLKGQTCDLLHPRALPDGYIESMNRTPAGAAAARICSFYLTPQGCSRGRDCAFAHPVGREAERAVQRSLDSSRRPCQYFFSPSGCRLGNECPFSHQPTAPPTNFHSQAAQQNPIPELCPHFQRGQRSCVNQNCNLIHLRSSICDFWLSERGCKKANFCTFLHAVNALSGQPDASSQMDVREMR